MTAISGVWLPIITPFVDGAVDLAGYERLLRHYLSTGITGVFPVGTTGESPTLDEGETEAIIERTLDVVGERMPVFVGVGGTRRPGSSRRSGGSSATGFPGSSRVAPTTTGPARTASTRTSARSPRRPTARFSSTTSRTGRA